MIITSYPGHFWDHSRWRDSVRSYAFQRTIKTDDDADDHSEDGDDYDDAMTMATTTTTTMTSTTMMTTTMMTTTMMTMMTMTMIMMPPKFIDKS